VIAIEDRERIFERFAGLHDARLGLVVTGPSPHARGAIRIDAEDGWCQFLVVLPAEEHSSSVF